MILNQNTQKIRIMFWHSHLHKRHLQFHCTQTCRYGANGLCNPFEQLLDPMLKVFLLITELLLNRILIFFFCRVEQPAVFITLLTMLCARTEHHQIFFISFSSLSIWRLPLHAKMAAQSFCIRCRISNPVFLAQGIASSRSLPSMYRSVEVLDRHAKRLHIQASPRAWTFVKNLFAIK